MDEDLSDEDNFKGRRKFKDSASKIDNEIDKEKEEGEVAEDVEAEKEKWRA